MIGINKVVKSNFVISGIKNWIKFRFLIISVSIFILIILKFYSNESYKESNNKFH